MDYEQTKMAYQELYEIMDKYKEVLQKGISICDLSIKTGLPLRVGSDINWIKLSEYIHIGIFGKNRDRKILWPDDGRRPFDDEFLMQVCFPSGPYIFHDSHYCVETFDEFFNELKSFGPKYCDTKNHSLYFSLDKAKEVFDNYQPIYLKYSNRVKKEILQQQKEELEEILKNLIREMDEN